MVSEWSVSGQSMGRGRFKEHIVDPILGAL